MGPIQLISQNEGLIYNIAFGIVVSYSIFGWLTLTGINLNYGRLSNSMMNCYLNPKLAWFLFQVPNLLWAAYFILYKGQSLSFGFALFIVHYINRDLVYPLSLKTNTKVPLQITLNAFIFTLGNGFLQGSRNINNQDTFDLFRTILGTLIFFIGMGINIYSDKILQKAKQKALKDAKQQQNSEKKGQSNRKKYSKIDKFLFKYISNPNYLGQIIEWSGYAIVCWHFESFMFAFSTLNILVPAAMVRSKWNHQNIDNYQKQRKAIFPFVL